ncbi:Hypothetical protein I5071_74240 [Sandaracinus amylolyticus]|nr:Hypothetical protein I5071_74240 [Sandaracinus amylolyticus]
MRAAGRAAAIVMLIAIGIPTSSAQDEALIVERVRLPRAPEVDVGDRIATIVRFDLRRYALRFLTESHEGPRRPATDWVREHRLVGAINAGMFLPSGRSCGYLRARGEVRSNRRPARFDAVIGFDPRASAAPFAIGGTGCGVDLDGMTERYDSVLQGVRMMVDCEGRAQRTWRTRRYSAALLGADREGRAVMVHVRTPYRMQVLAEMLAADALGLRGLVYMEGGPEASLVVDAGRTQVREMGSWEDGFHEADDVREFWDLPNVVGVEAR